MSVRVCLLGILLMSAITGCSYNGQQYAQQRMNAMQSQCDSYGFRRGTQEYSNCLMNIDQRMRNDAAVATQQSFQAAQQFLAPPTFQKTCPQMLNARPGANGAGC